MLIKYKATHDTKIMVAITINCCYAMLKPKIPNSFNSHMTNFKRNWSRIKKKLNTTFSYMAHGK